MDLLATPPVRVQSEDFATEQRKDQEIMEIIDLLEYGKLPANDHRAHRIALQKPTFTMENGMLFYLDPRQDHFRRAVVPKHLREQLLWGHHSSPM